MNIFIEALIFGLITAIIGFIIATSLMFLNNDFELKNYHFWFRVMIGYFITGFLLYIIFEYTGIKKRYCEKNTISNFEIIHPASII